MSTAELVPWWRSTQIERQSVAAATQTGREMVLGQALDRIRANGMHERVESAYALARHAVWRIAEFDELAERACQLRPRLESCVFEIEDVLTLGVRELIARYMVS
jgi:hypothetical protein